jgi:hypothetical protein
MKKILICVIAMLTLVTLSVGKDMELSFNAGAGYYMKVK